MSSITLQHLDGTIHEVEVPDVRERGREMNAMTDLGVSDQIARLMHLHGAKTREDLRRTLGLSKNTIRNWERAGSVPDHYRRRITGPWQLLAALSVLRDAQLTDAEARKAATGLLQQLEVAHG